MDRELYEQTPLGHSPEYHAMKASHNDYTSIKLATGGLVGYIGFDAAREIAAGFPETYVTGLGAGAAAYGVIELNRRRHEGNLQNFGKVNPEVVDDILNESSEGIHKTELRNTRGGFGDDEITLNDENTQLHSLPSTADDTLSGRELYEEFSNDQTTAYLDTGRDKGFNFWLVNSYQEDDRSLQELSTRDIERELLGISGPLNVGKGVVESFLGGGHQKPREDYARRAKRNAQTI